MGGACWSSLHDGLEQMGSLLTLNGSMTSCNELRDLHSHHRDCMGGAGRFYLHDGLEQAGISLAHAFTEGSARGNLEGQNTGVHLVVGAIVESGTDVHHWEAGQHTARHHLLQALVEAERECVRGLPGKSACQSLPQVDGS